MSIKNRYNTIKRKPKMTRQSQSILGLFGGLAILIIFSSCTDYQPVTNLDLGFANETEKSIYLGEWILDEVEYICFFPEAINLSAVSRGDCVEDYCHTGSRLVIKEFNIPGYFEYSISPSVPFFNNGDNRYMETFDDFFETWGFYSNGLVAYHRVGKEIGSNCWVSFKWSK